MDKITIVHAGQKVVTKAGTVAMIAYVSRFGIPYAYSWCGIPVPVQVCGDAYGGEHDQVLGLAA